jgi:hypothetical protein
VRDVPAEPLPAKWSVRWLYVAAVAALVAGLVFEPFRFGDFVEVRLSRTEAADIADRALRARNLDPASWRRVVQFVPNLDAASFEYVRRLEGEETADETVRDRTFAGVWYVRYFRPMESEEWRFYVNQQGRAYRSDH